MIASLTGLLAAIPSPSRNVIELGPITLRMYGLCIALGVIAAVMISSRRWEARGGNPDDIGTIALWAVPAGVIGARLYHVATDWKTYQDDWGAALNITKGGLGIPGGVALGVLVGVIVVKRKGLPVRPLLDVVAPAIPVAQAIGRLGNWFNQELYGRPTTLPWGLRIDAPVDAAGNPFPAGTLFHPTFLYEALWNLALAGLLIKIDKKRRLHPGELFILYVFGYSLGRLWVEDLRIDHASLIWGVRVNIWMSVIVGLAAVAIFLWNRRPGAPEPAPYPAATGDVSEVLGGAGGHDGAEAGATEGAIDGADGAGGDGAEGDPVTDEDAAGPGAGAPEEDPAPS
ncbi:MAG: prolipoprotein diacylglyceryl transferase [Acidimicrobiales bacterium]